MILQTDLSARSSAMFKRTEERAVEGHDRTELTQDTGRSPSLDEIASAFAECHAVALTCGRPAHVDTLHLGIGRCVRPIDSPSRFWRNRVAGDRTDFADAFCFNFGSKMNPGTTIMIDPGSNDLGRGEKKRC